MPGFNRTGPMGRGPMTGRGMGLCTGAANRGYGQGMGMGRGMGRGFGRGFGQGFGRGMGMGRGFGRGMGWAPLDAGYASDPTQERAAIQGEMAALGERLEELRLQLERLEENKD